MRMRIFRTIGLMKIISQVRHKFDSEFKEMMVKI